MAREWLSGGRRCMSFTAAAYPQPVAQSSRSTSADELIGRQAEAARLDALLDRLSEGGGALVIRGEAGIGKSAMLALAGERATALGFAKLATVGVETEAELAFAGLHQLLFPIVRSIELLPASQRQPLNAVFGTI